MAADLREQLQKTLSGSYTLERELGGGGMSRVFVATETSLDRKVVIKVLPPELGEGVSVERFKREIQLAAQLTHPHIVPVHAAGETNGLPYYTMPLVDGFSLRTRLVKSGALAITEVIGVLRDVAKALAYAHEHGVVHRDIKPDNVLITGGSAVVTDFGIAKAIAAARTGPSASTLTQIGSALGTPAYMAPEQAAADPGTNHRADIYAFGVMAYEMLAGKPPFHGRSPQKLLAAQMAEQAQVITELRPDTPTLLADLVMRCLEKDADSRPQAASDLVKVLESVTSGGGHPAMPEILLGGRPKIGRALAMWAAAFFVVVIVARAAIIAIGLPDWVFPGAVVVMALGLPVILLTYVVHRGAHQALTASALTPGGSHAPHSTLTRLAVRASPHISWRRTTLGGVYALAAFVLIVAGYMALRSMGVGAIGSLLAKGTLQKNERILVADFRYNGPDTTLGTVVTEAFRTGLSQSQSIVVMPATAVRDVLRRMQRTTSSRVDFNLAREVATREGIKAFVDGEILSVGGKYLLSARLIEAQTGEPLAVQQATADGEGEILAAIDRLTKQLRERVGESLRSIRDARPLEQVTTPSLEALRKYVQGSRALSFDGDYNKGTALLEEAIALDSGFAMAYRRLAVELNNRGGQQVRVMDLIAKAFEHRDRLSDAERYLTLGSYYTYGPQQDAARAISAYESLIDLQPHNATALNNVSLLYQHTRDYEKAHDVLSRAAALTDAPAVVFTNMVWVGMARGDTAAVRTGLRVLETRFASNAFMTITRARLMHSLGRIDSAAALAASVRRAHGSDLATVANATRLLAELAQIRGRAADAKRWYVEHADAEARRGAPAARLELGLALARIDGWLRDQPSGAQRALDGVLAEQPLASMAHASRPYEQLVTLLTSLGRADRAKAVLSMFEQERARITRLDDDRIYYQMRGDIAFAERRFADAVREYRQADRGPCVTCILPRLAEAYVAAGHADSAIAAYNRYLETADAFRTTNPRVPVGVDADYLAISHRRLGELLERKGDRRAAIDHYVAIADLWKNADAELQPRVAEIRQRIARLKDAERR